MKGVVDFDVTWVDDVVEEESGESVGRHLGVTGIMPVVDVFNVRRITFNSSVVPGGLRRPTENTISTVAVILIAIAAVIVVVIAAVFVVVAVVVVTFIVVVVNVILTLFRILAIIFILLRNKSRIEYNSNFLIIISLPVNILMTAQVIGDASASFNVIHTTDGDVIVPVAVTILFVVVVVGAAELKFLQLF